MRRERLSLLINTFFWAVPIVGISHLQNGAPLYPSYVKNPAKDPSFKLVNELVKPDAKKRLTLGSAVAEDAAAYNVYKNDLGQIILDPVRAVPAYEMWLYENKAALASVKRGLADSAAGRTKYLGSFAKYAKQDEP